MKQPFGVFSSSWYSSATDEELSMLKNIMVSSLRIYNPKSTEIFWTTFKDSKTKLQGNSYTKPPKNGLPQFLPCNAKATNNYRNHWFCMYTVNIFKNPIELSYLRSKGVGFNEEEYALGQMIQFIWRGCIREGKPMKVLIFSDRMRRLLENWLNS